jgi:dipeptidyl aminopeptidase/acylaminoacyl peptidase
VTGLLIGGRIAERPGALFFDAELDGRWRSLQKTFPGLTLQLISWDHGFKTAVVRSEGLRDSGTFWKVDLATTTTKVLGHAYPAIRPDRVGSTQMLKYKAQDGLDVEGVLTLPPKGPQSKLPVVVMPHGGPIGPFDGIGFDWWAQAYADAGYAVFQPNFRGSGGYGAAFRDAGFGEWGGKMLSDISDGLKTLVDAGTVDPKRACIVGASYGGYAALAGVTVQQGLYRCSVSVSGVSDVRNFFNWVVNTGGRQTASVRFWRAAIGAVGRTEKIMTEISPTTYASRTDAPVLLIHGEDDTVVPILQSRIMESALKDAEKPVEFITMKGEDHWLSSEATRIEMLTHALAFVKKHNPPN